VLGAALALPGIAHPSKLEPGALAESFSLLPLGYLQGMPLIPVAWSLFHEVKFYLFFALLIPLPRMARMICVSGAVAVTIGYLIVPELLPGRLNAFLFSHFNFYFLAGVLVAWLVRRKDLAGSGSPSKSGRAGGSGSWLGWLMAGALCFGLVATVDVCLSTAVPILLLELGYILSGGLLLYGVVMFDFHSARNVPRWAIFLGDASYATYLVHLPVYELVCFLFLRLRAGSDSGWLDGNGLAMTVLVLLPFMAQAAGCVYYRLIERPLIRRMKAER
jgi:peptidoglycan/LPS O-acetylase OafA/YrhL